MEKVLANIRPVDKEIDIEELKKRKKQEEKDRHLINGFQAILRLNNGKLIQKQILKYFNEDDYSVYSKQKIFPVLNNPHYDGKYWKVWRTGERNHIKEYHLIDTL
ncbi:hypothetical protein [Nitratiruptor tergarcus]|uniref:Uncharacterized protein n=1 Tax=Nitratiruptor tergarcus DSM 16512 TaxID=1069081 RepID=A0A1W1WQ15_9BACT|nr:hypothetical protein [Nitratiruptor tergarcus]SMC08398.1 hypothetical protein SAMN05660197_0148 [Nitratiruptor tergarcus DSM 16512]